MSQHWLLKARKGTPNATSTVLNINGRYLTTFISLLDRTRSYGWPRRERREIDGGSGVHPSGDGSRSIEQGSRPGSSDILAASLSSPEVRYTTIHENAESFVFPLPPAADIVLSSISQAPTRLRDGLFNSIGPGSSGDRNEKVDTGDGHKRDGDQTATGASGIRASHKRTADDACLNAGGGMPGSEKAPIATYRGQYNARNTPIDEIDDAGE
ncbi:MAG: hypothetical protein Q9171_005340 [Xanthocarpia ochracea]